MQRNHSRALRAICAVAAALAFTSSASAATVGPSGDAFYTPPTVLPAGGHGTLIWYRPAKMSFTGGPAVNAWTVLYKSQSVGATADVVSGSVIEPSAAWTGSGARPVVDVAIGTQGLNHNSAPSVQLVAGSDYAAPDIVDALNKGWAVDVTDYAGYLNGQVPDYIVGQSEGHAVLDNALAATQIPGAGISPSAQTVTWGYSQGGGGSAWAAQLWPSYAPSIDLVGDASGGIPSDLNAVANNLNGSPFAAFLLYAVIGMNTDYPGQINLAGYTNATGNTAVKTAESDNLVEALSGFLGANIDNYTVNNAATGKPWTLANLLAVPSIQNVIQQQALGGTAISVPMFEYHSTLDEVIPLAQAKTLHSLYCSEGVKVDWQTYIADHILGDGAASGDVVTWIGNRFNGAAVVDNC